MTNFMKYLIGKEEEKKEAFELKEILPCYAGPSRIRIIAQINSNLDHALSILYLTFPNANYSEQIGMVSYRYQQHNITLYKSGKVTMTFLKDKEDAHQLLEQLIKYIDKANEYYQKHGSPSEEMLKAKKRATPLNTRKYLPGTNCGECGEQNCYAFAVRLHAGETELTQCKPLLSAQYTRNRESLEKFLMPIRLRLG